MCSDAGIFPFLCPRCALNWSAAPVPAFSPRVPGFPRSAEGWTLARGKMGGREDDETDDDAAPVSDGMRQNKIKQRRLGWVMRRWRED